MYNYREEFEIMSYKDPEYLKNWKKANPEKVEAYRLKGLENSRKRGRKWYYKHHEENKLNSAKYAKEWRQNNPEKRKTIKRRHDLKKYGITEEQYEDMVLHQLGVCAICEKEQKDNSRRLDIDHCHKTGKVRGLLCSKCNTALGLLNEELELFNKAVNYLRKSST